MKQKLTHKESRFYFDGEDNVRWCVTFKEIKGGNTFRPLKTVVIAKNSLRQKVFNTTRFPNKTNAANLIKEKCFANK